MSAMSLRTFQGHQSQAYLQVSRRRITSHILPGGDALRQDGKFEIVF